MDGLIIVGGSMEDLVCGNCVWGMVIFLLVIIIKLFVVKKV